MISAKSIEKRKNYGQILEALANNIHTKKSHIVVADDAVVPPDMLRKSLEANGYPGDGLWHIDTYCGEHDAIVGKMFWGVTKDPEDQLWYEGRTMATDNREIRTSGLKFSHVEMKALVTHFGAGNAVCKEILSHAQGNQNVKDMIRIIQGANGEFNDTYPVIAAANAGFVDVGQSIFHTADTLKGTIVDEEFVPDGFLLKLPVAIQAVVNKTDKDDFYMSVPQDINIDTHDSYAYDRVFIPNSMLRRSWHHPNGKWGLSIIGAYVNHIARACAAYELSKDIMDHLLIVKAVYNYFQGVSKIMGSKTGELSTYTMGVRYPHSSRATVSLSDSLPENTIEIHEDMAQGLGVKTNDVVLAERFPCLGFVSIRPQRVVVTKDPQCKYVIRVSGNSLVSMTLDFDGDTLFVASFKTPQAIELLRNYMDNPEPLCDAEIKRINARKVPQIIEMSLDDFSITAFMKPSVDEHAELVRKATGVKSHTGPVIALAYNLMRIVEKNIPFSNKKAHVELELLLDFLGNTVFKQKHGIESLQEAATDAICVGNVEKMVELGFRREPSQLLCDLIRKEAASIGTRDLVWYHQHVVKERGGSKIINKIVRLKNRLWFATRSTMGPFKLREHLKDGEVDLPSMMMRAILRAPYEKASDVLEKKISERTNAHIVATMSTYNFKEVAKALCKLIDGLLVKAAPNSKPEVFTNIGVLS